MTYERDSILRAPERLELIERARQLTTLLEKLYQAETAGRETHTY